MDNTVIKAKIVERTQLSEDIVGLTLVPVNNDTFPTWEPGAHAELVLDIDPTSNEKVYRHYSLCSDYKDNHRWQIAILLEREGRGGSRYIHQHLQANDEITISCVRNHFEFKPLQKCFFIAGGIGITPILPMMQKATELGIEWKLFYTARERSRLVFLDVLNTYGAEKIILNGDKEDGHLNLDTILQAADENTSVYSCGPQRLLDALDEKSKDPSSLWKLKIERFSAVESTSTDNKSFDVVIKNTGQKLHIPSDKSILEVLKENGFKVNSSCKNGICGSCETVVISGLPDHRDSILSDDEKADNETMMICVSRALSDELVLSLDT